MKFKIPWFTKSDQSVSYTTVESTSELAKLLGASSTSKSSVRVTHKSALQASVSLACARVIAQGIAQVPLKVFRSREDGGSDPQPTHTLYKVLHDTPNEWQSSYDWREMTALHLVFAGNAYSQKTFDNKGNVIELLPLHPGDVRVERKGHELFYKVKRDESHVSIAREKILHLRGISWNGFEGLDGVTLAREAIGLSVATEEHGAKQFANGATIPGILTTDQNLTPEQLTALRESFEKAQSSLQNAWRVMVTHGGLDYKPTGITNEQAQFIQLRSYQVEEVCRCFGVIPIMVGHSDKTATYASAEQMFLAHLIHTMGPWYARLEQAFNQQLLSDSDLSSGIYTKFIDSGILRGSVTERGNYYKTMFEIGAMNPNEIRAKEEMNPYEAGNEFRVPMNSENPDAEKNDEQDDGV